MAGVDKLLIVVDMLEGFCVEGNVLYCGADSREIIPRIRSLIADEYNPTNQPVVFLMDNHEPDDPEFEMFPPHCIIGTAEAEIVPELQGVADNELRVPKNRYSGFHETPLDAIITRHAPALIEVVGVCTNICVMYTVEELRNRYLPVTVRSDMVASFDADAHAFALGQMATVLGATVTPTP